MSGFWESELGAITGDAADAFSKFKTAIPEGTMALARIDSFGYEEYNGNKFLKVEWVLTDGDFKGAAVDQKLKVFGDPKAKDPVRTRFKSLNMLKLIYQLFDIKPKHANEPSESELAVFIGKSAGIKIRETEPNVEGKQYNWVAEIHETKGFKCETGIRTVITHSNVTATHDSMDSAFSRNSNVHTQPVSDDVPF